MILQGTSDQLHHLTPAPVLPEEADEGRSGCQCPQVLHLCVGVCPNLLLYDVV